MNINEIPTSELEKDLSESIKDIEDCKMALGFGVNQYSGGSVIDRLETNKKIVKIINAELEKRVKEKGITDFLGKKVKISKYIPKDTIILGTGE